MSLGIVGACADGIVVASDGAMTECRLDGTYQRIREDAPKFWLLRDDVVLVAVGFADFVGRAVSEMQAFVGQHGDTPTLFYDAATFLATAIAGWYAASEAHAGAARPDLLEAGWTVNVVLVGRDGRHGALRFLSWCPQQGIKEWGGAGLIWCGCYEKILPARDDIARAVAAGQPAAECERVLRAAIRDAAAVDERVGSRVYSYRLPRQGEPCGRLPDDVEIPARAFRSAVAFDTAMGAVGATAPAALSFISASQIATTNLAAISADLGDLGVGRIHNPANTAGILLGGYPRPGGWTTYFDFMAAGTDALFCHPKLRLNADGSASFGGALDLLSPQISPPLINAYAQLHTPGLAHGMTSLVGDDVSGLMTYQAANAGGLNLLGFNNGTALDPALLLSGNFGGTPDTTTTSSSKGVVSIEAWKKNGTTRTATTGEENILSVHAGGAAVAILKASGALWLATPLADANIASAATWNAKYGSGDAIEVASVKTGAPTGGSQAVWKMGSIASAQMIGYDTTQYIEIEIGGVAYPLLIGMKQP